MAVLISDSFKIRESTSDEWENIYLQVESNIISILNAVYPIGSIYMSVNAISPANIFGFGTWEQIEDTFLLAAGQTYSAGSTGGEATHTLTTNEMPSHNHEEPPWMWAVSKTFNTGGYNIPGGTSTGNADTYNDGKSKQTQYVINTGGGQAHNNMPPYLAVYMWKRTA